MFKKVVIFVFVFFMVAQAKANVNQMNNEYYDRGQCVQQVLLEITDRYKECIKTTTELDCSLTDKEIQQEIIVFCGEDNKNTIQTRGSND